MLFKRCNFSSLVLLFASVLNLSSIASSNNTCSVVLPIQLPIRNTTVTEQISRRGIALSIGSPGQSLAFEATGSWNNTYVFDSSSPCSGNDAPLHCAAQAGGFFNKGSSVSWSQGPNMSDLSTAPEMWPDHSKDDPGRDTIHIGSTLSLSGFPLGISHAQAGTVDNMNTIGLGTNSTLISALIAAKAIGSRTWGYFNGWTGAEAQQQMDGSLVFGGYDGAKITGNNITLPFTNNQNCVSGLVVTVTGINMNLKNGSDASLFSSSAGVSLQSCLSVNNPLMSFPEAIWTSFANVAGCQQLGRSIGINDYAMAISANESYDGDLTISLASGLDIRIPNHQLIVPDFGISQQGQPIILNETSRVVLINSLEGVNKDDMPQLGRAFFTSAYLLVDDDHRQFTLWKSNPTAQQQLLPIGPSSCTDPSPTSSNSTTPASTTSAASPGVSGDSAVSTATLSTGAIVGISVGVVALLALLGAAFVWMRKRRAQRRAAEIQLQDTKNEDVKYQELEVSDNPGDTENISEMPSDRHPAQEMPLARDQPSTLAPYEMASNEHGS